MIYSTFRDCLMVDNFDTFRDSINEINDLKDTLKTQKRRVSPPVHTYMAYRLIKQIAEPLVRIFNSRRYSQETILNKFSYALQKLDLLVRKLLDYGSHQLAEQLSKLYQTLFELLPSNTVIQHQLFDSEQYETDSKKPPTTIGFINWLQDYHLLGFLSRDIARKRAIRPVQVVQHQIKFSRA